MYISASFVDLQHHFTIHEIGCFYIKVTISCEAFNFSIYNGECQCSVIDKRFV